MLPEYIYEGSSVTLQNFQVMILLFIMRHNLTYEGTDDLLKHVSEWKNCEEEKREMKIMRQSQKDQYKQPTIEAVINHGTKYPGKFQLCQPVFMISQQPHLLENKKLIKH